VAVDDDVVRRGAEARDLGVVADLENERGGGAAVGARLEQQRIALRSKLVVNLLARLATLSIVDWIWFCDMLGSKMSTLGPKSGGAACARCSDRPDSVTAQRIAVRERVFHERAGMSLSPFSFWAREAQAAGCALRAPCSFSSL
jgi:hypothetical protein